MPKNARQKQSKRRGVQQKEVYRYTQNLNTPARPVDTYVDPGKQSTGLDGLIAALDGGGKLFQQYGQIKEQKNKEDKEEGYLKGLAGQEPEENATDAKVAGFEMAAGEGTTLDFKDQVDGYLRENWNTDPDTFRQGLEEMLPEYTEGKSQAFLEGFVPKANRAIEQSFQEYQKLNENQMKQDGLTNIGKGFTGDLEIIFEEKEPDDRPQAIRKALTKHQKRNKSYMSRMEISEHIVDIMGRRAIEQGDPDLMDFAEVADENGTKLVDTPLVNKIKSYQQSAIRAYDQDRRSEAAVRKQAKKEMLAQVERDMVLRLEGLSSMNTTAIRASKQQMINEFSEPGDNGIALDAGDLQTYIDAHNSLIEAEGFNDMDVHQAKVEIMDAIDGMGSADDFENVLSTLVKNKYQLTKDTYEKMYGQALRERKVFDQREAQEKKNSYSSSRGSFMKTLRQIDPSVTNPFAGGLSEEIKSKITAQDNLRKQEAVRYLYDERQELMEKTDYNPSRQQITDMFKRVKEWAYETYPPVDVEDKDKPTGGNNNNPGSGGKPSPEGGKELSEEDEIEAGFNAIQ